MGEDKKDLTSLVELSALELAKNPALAHGADGHELTAQPIEKVSEADFGNLEEMSRQAAHDAANEPPPPEPPPPPAPAVEAAPPAEPPPLAEAAPALDGLPPLTEAPADGMPALDAAPIAANDTAPGEAPPSAAPSEGAQTPQGGQSFDLPSFSQIGTGESAAPPAEGGAAPGFDAPPPLSEDGGSATPPPMAINEGFPSAPQGVPPSTKSAEPPQTATVTAPPVATPAPAAPAHAPSKLSFTGAEAPPPDPKSALDPNRVPVKMAPAGSEHAHKGGAPSKDKQDMSQLKKFAEKISIGRPKIEGAPAFSLLIQSATGTFDEKTVKAIENAITSEEFGIRLEDVSVQLSAGKLLVPQISEFAAVTLAQKLRDVVDTIDVDLASEIFKSATLDASDGTESMLLDTEEFESHREEVHDVGAEPRSADDLFSTNLPEVREFQVTRILSTIMASDLVPAEIAENPSGKEFEGVIERLTTELMNRAFKLGAHGVIGVSFNLRAIDAYRDAEGKIKRAYRLLGNGTAVRVRRRPSEAASQYAAETENSELGEPTSSSTNDPTGSTDNE